MANKSKNEKMTKTIIMSSDESVNGKVVDNRVFTQKEYENHKGVWLGGIVEGLGYVPAAVTRGDDDEPQSYLYYYHGRKPNKPNYNLLITPFASHPNLTVDCRFSYIGNDFSYEISLEICDPLAHTPSTIYSSYSELDNPYTFHFSVNLGNYNYHNIEVFLIVEPKRKLSGEIVERKRCLVYHNYE